MEKVLFLVILIVTMIGMIFEEKIGIKLCVVGCIGALLLVVTGVISEKQALKSIDLKTIFLFGGPAKSGDLLLEPTIKSMEASLLPIWKGGKIKVLPSHLPESDAAILGASSLVWDAISKAKASSI